MNIWELILHPLTLLYALLSSAFFYMYQQAKSIEDLVIMTVLSLGLPMLVVIASWVDRRLSAAKLAQRRSQNEKLLQRRVRGQ